MKKLIAVAVILSLTLLGTNFLPVAFAQTENIASVEAAKEIAANAGGVFVEGEAAPALTGNQIALPVIDETSGKVLGHIVAERSALVSALNAAGHTEVSTAIAASEAGTTAAVATGAGFLGGTAGAIAIGVAVIGGAALLISSGGSDSTSSH